MEFLAWLALGTPARRGNVIHYRPWIPAFGEDDESPWIPADELARIAFQPLPSGG